MRRLPASLLAVVVAMLLAACGSTPMGIQPSEAGNFVVHFAPADAQVVVTEAGFETSSISSLGVSTEQAQEGVKRFQLAPGSYNVSVTKAGYLPFEDSFEIAQGEAEGQGAELNMQIELDVDPNPPSSGPGSVIDPSGLSLRGNPNFSPSSLTSQQRLWFERLRAAMNNPDQTMDPMEMARSDDAYAYGRGLFTHNHSLLLGLRATGDLRFLDEVDELMQEVRDNLDDSWCGGVDDKISKGWYGSMEGEDGYLNFRRRHGSGDVYCRDVADLEEGMAHSHIALVMYAYHMNRGVESPSGVDYGERADFWLDYLINEFEAKWRDRSGREFPRMDFMDTKFCHTYNSFQMYYYFVGRALQDQGDSRASAYLSYARDMTDRMFETPYLPDEQGSGFVETSTPIGDAVIWSFGAPGEELDRGDASLEACPTTYTRYMVPSLVQLRLEGVYRWDDAIMNKIATTLAYFVFDTDDVSDRDEPFAAGVTGGDKVKGILPTEYRTRFDSNSYVISSLANIMPWNHTGRIAEISMQVFEDEESDLDNPNAVHLPASFLLNSTLAID